MNPITPHAAPWKAAMRAFTLVETMIALLVLGVGSTMLYETFRTSMFMMDKNVALNEANTNLQWGYYRMLALLESAGTFVDCASYNSSTQTFSAVSPGTWGNAVRFMQLCPITCYVEPDNGSGYTVSNPPPPSLVTYLQSTDQYVSFSYNTALYKASCIPSDARVFPTFPEVSGTVTTGNSQGVKPGLAFDSLTTPSSGTITLHFPSPLGSNAFLSSNRAYFMVEGALAVTTDPNDGHKILLYFPDTNQPANSFILCQKMDGSNQTQPGDSSIPSGGTAGTFCIPSGSTSVQVLFPIRSFEFLNVMSRDGGSATRNNTWLNVNCKFRQRLTL